MTVKFVQDTSKFWYKPDISREQGITIDVYSEAYTCRKASWWMCLIFFYDYQTSKIITERNTKSIRAEDNFSLFCLEAEFESGGHSNISDKLLS